MKHSIVYFCDILINCHKGYTLLSHVRNEYGLAFGHTSPSECYTEYSFWLGANADES